MDEEDLNPVKVTIFSIATAIGLLSIIIASYHFWTLLSS